MKIEMQKTQYKVTEKERGQSLVEVGLTFPIYMLIVLMAIYMIVAMYHIQVMNYAAQKGIEAAIRAGDPDEAQTRAVEAVNSVLKKMNVKTGAPQVSVALDPLANEPITISLSSSIKMPMMDGKLVNLKSSAAGYRFNIKCINGSNDCLPQVPVAGGGNP